MTHSGRLDQIMAALGAEEWTPVPAALSMAERGAEPPVHPDAQRGG